MADEPEDVAQEPPPGMLADGTLNVVEKGSPRVPPVVVDDEGNEVDPEADDDAYDENGFEDLLEDDEDEGD